MYKDVWKRVLAVVVTICLVVTLVQWPTAVKAGDSKTYHTYQYGESESAGTVDAKTTAAVFMTGQNASEGAEIFESVAFDVHVESGASAKAFVKLYTSPNPGDPASGVFVCSNEVINLVEGTNAVSFAAVSPKLVKGECFSIVVTLEGEGVSFYTDRFDREQYTFAKDEDGNWVDLGEDSRSVTIRAVTYDERLTDREKGGFFKRVSALLSNENITEDISVQTPAEGTQGDDTNPVQNISTETPQDNGTGAETPQDNVTPTETAGTEEGTSEAVREADGDGNRENASEEGVEDILEISENPLLRDPSSGMQLNYNSMTLAVNEEATLQILNPLSNAVAYEWTVDYPNHVQVTPNGSPATSANILGKAIGYALVTALAKDNDGNVIDRASCVVIVREGLSTLQIELQDSDFDYEYDGTEKRPEVIVYDTAAGNKILDATQDYTLQYVDNIEVSTDEVSARVIVIGQGDNYRGKAEMKEFQILPRSISRVPNVNVEDMKQADFFGIDDEDQIKELIAARIQLEDLLAGGTQVLTYGADYTIILNDNPTAPGTRTATIEGMGNYTGTREIEYVIKRDISGADITVQDGPFIYTGKEIHPEVTVSMDGTVLRSESYEVAYANCIDVSTEDQKASILISGRGDFYGDCLTLTFEIMPKDIGNTDIDIVASSVDIVPYPLPVAVKGDTLENSKPDFTMTYNGYTLSPDTDYYIDDASMELLNGDGTFDTATRARLIIYGQGNYTGERQLDFDMGDDIKDAIDSVTLESTSYTYTGKAITPKVTVVPKAGFEFLTENEDYYIDYVNNINAGTASVIVRGIGLYGGYVDPQEFTIEPAAIDSFTDGNSSFSYTGRITYSPTTSEMEKDVAITYLDNVLLKDVDYTLTYTYPNTGNHIKVGTAAVTINGIGNYQGSRSFNYEIVEYPIEGNNISIEMTRDYDYTGVPVKPTVSVIYTDNSGNRITLAAGTDYELDILPDDTSSGIKTIRITGIGNYSGTREEELEISKIDVDTLAIEIQNPFDLAGYEGKAGYKAVKKYTGQDIFLTMTIRYIKDGIVLDELQRGVDYDITYNNNKEMSKWGSTAEFVIEGKGNYTGKCIIPFLIYKEITDCEVNGIPTGKVYNGDAIELEDLILTDGSNTLVKGLDYTVQYENNIDVTTAANPAKVTMSGVDMALLPTQNGCYVGSRSNTFAITRLDLAAIPQNQISITVKDKVYQGNRVTLTSDDITVIYTTPSGVEMTLVYGRDFEIESNKYSNNNGVTDLASAYIKGLDGSNFFNSKKVTFRIIGKDIGELDADITYTDTWDYTGSQIRPTVRVSDGANQLVEGTDYTVAYSDNVNAGKAKITITGIGNYGGTITKFFTILPLELTDANTTLSGVNASYTYLPGGVAPDPIVRFQKEAASSVITLAKGEDKDYVLVYDGIGRVGNASVTVIGRGNYTGSVVRDYTITQKEITEDMISDIEPQGYEGMNVCPAVEIIHDGYTLQEGIDYEVTYKDNDHIGSDAKVIVTGKGNYTGTAEKSFRITTSILDSSIIITCDAAGTTQVYTGKEIRPAVTVRSVLTGTNLVQGTDYEVTYENNINAGGELEATVTVTGIGTYAKSKTFYFTIIPKDIEDSDVLASFVGNKTSYEYTGSQIKPAINLVYNGSALDYINKSDCTVTYGTNIETGTDAGIITINGVGGNYIGTKILTFDIVAKSIGSGTAFADGFSMEAIPAQGHTGSPICPTPAITYRDTDGSIRTLTYGDDADYTFEYENNTDIGIATIKIIGRGNYKGTVKKTFLIKGGLNGAEITFPDVSYEKWKSVATRPQPTVVLNGTTLRNGLDYTVTYKTNNDFVGDAEVIITGAGNYGGSISKAFRITGDLANADVPAIPIQPFTGSAITFEELGVTYDGHALYGGGIDYTVSYSGNTKIGTATITLTGNNYYTGERIVTFRIIPSTGHFLVDSPGAFIYCGSQIKPEVTVRFEDEVLVENEDYTVTYGENTNAGVGTITIEGINSYINISPLTKTFTINPLNVNDLIIQDTVASAVPGAIASREYTGAPIIPDIKLLYQIDGKTIYTLKNSEFEITCPSGNNVNLGTANIAITGKTDNVRGTRNEMFAIVAKNVSSATVTLNGGNSYNYTGYPIYPEILVRCGLNDLVQNVDYLVEYADNQEAGTGKIIIRGINNYTGVKEVNFSILPVGINSSSVAIYSIPSQMFTGNPITPDVKVTYTDMYGVEHVLVEDVDYTVSYQNNTNVGATARAVITGKGNYTGTKAQNFNITPRDINAEDVIVKDITNQTYTGQAVTPALTITCGSYSLMRGRDYDVAFNNNIELGVATVIIIGRGNFTSSRTATFNIVANGLENATVEGLEESYPYTGKAIEPTGITVKIGEKVLLPGTDYTVSYRNNIDAGTAVLVLSAAGEYGGEKEVDFKIAKKKLSDSDIILEGFVPVIIYTGETVEQNITLSYGEMTLVTPDDYSIQYVGNTDIGMAVMTITGNGNYTGNIVKEFEITEKSVIDDNVVIENISSTYTYMGQEIRPQPTLILNGIELVEGEDYELSFENNTNIGIALMTITGKNNYTGIREVNFTILRRNIHLSTVSEIGTQTYTGLEIRPTVSVTDSGNILVAGRDYDLIYSNNRLAGTATAVVAGMGNYTATKTVRFDIRPANVTSAAIVASGNSSISISWPSSGVVTGYEIYRAGKDGKFERVARERETNFTDKQLTSGQKYSYKVRSYLVTENDTYYGEFSPVVQGTT